MAIKRSELIDSESAGYYHLMSRCVRRTLLCGVDKETGQSYAHRRQWIENRILELANMFAIEVYAYAIMSTGFCSCKTCIPSIHGHKSLPPCGL